jgi:8-oxo-dGTP pyrophosphatase MutT (NUDIX family)
MARSGDARVKAERKTMDDDELVWEKVRSEAGPELPLFSVRFDFMRHPTSAKTFKRLVLESVDWVNVVAVTRDGLVVTVEQYRFGSGEIGTEPAAGIVSPGEPHLAAAKRELLEETGYGNGDWRYLGSVQPNPAIHDNLCHHWLADGVVRLSEPSLDEGEAIRVRLMTPQELREAVAAGRIRHTLALSALSRVFQLWEPSHPAVAG